MTTSQQSVAGLVQAMVVVVAATAGVVVGAAILAPPRSGGVGVGVRWLHALHQSRTLVGVTSGSRARLIVAVLTCGALLAPAAAASGSPRASGVIAYSLNEPCGEYGTVRPDGGGRRAFARSCEGPVPAQPQFSADGRHVVVVLGQAIAVMSPAGFDPVVLRVDPALGYASPSLSPDGTRIAFVRDRGVWMAGVDGSGLRRLRDGTFARWSPAGDVLAVEHAGTLLLVDAATGATLRRVATGVESGADFAPDGRRLVYAREGDLYIGSGRSARKLTRGPARDGRPAWSPDGQSVAFWRVRYEPDESASIGELWVVKRDGTHQRRLLAAGGDADSGAYEVLADWQPRGVPRRPLMIPAAGDAPVTVGGACRDAFARVPGGPRVFDTDVGRMAAADFTGDGRSDAVVVVGGQLRLLVNDGAGRFPDVQDRAVALDGSPRALVTGDFGGDTAADVAVVDEHGVVRVLVGDGAGGFSAAGTATMPAGEYEAGVGDVDGDQRVDVVLLRTGADTAVHVLLSDASGGLTPAPVPRQPVGHSFGLTVADVDGDGRADIAVHGNDTELRFGTGDGAFPVSRPVRGGFVSPMSSRAAPFAVADLNADGHQDLVVGRQGFDDPLSSGGVEVLLADGAGNFASAAQLITQHSLLHAFAVADFTGDGALDVAYASSYTPAIHLAAGDGTGALHDVALGRAEARVGEHYAVRALVARTADGDTLPDLLLMAAPGAGAGSVDVLRGTGAPAHLLPPPQRVDARARRATVPYGRAATLLAVPDCSALEARPMTLMRRAVVRGVPQPWAPALVRHAPSSSGSFARDFWTVRASDKPSGTARYQWRFAGDATMPASASNVVAVDVAFRVRARGPAAPVPVGTRVRIAGLTRPGSQGDVVLERRRANAWRPMRRTRVRPGGRFAFTVRVRASATYRVRRPADATRVEGLSRTVHVRVP